MNFRIPLFKKLMAWFRGDKQKARHAQWLNRNRYSFWRSEQKRLHAKARRNRRNLARKLNLGNQWAR